MAMTIAVSPESKTLIKTICGTPIQNAVPGSLQCAGFRYCAIALKSTLVQCRRPRAYCGA
jgi:hypothetical protein